MVGRWAVVIAILRNWLAVSRISNGSIWLKHISRCGPGRAFF